MRDGTKSIPGALVRTSTTIPGGVVTTSSSMYQSNLNTVSSSGLIRGNHVTPNPHSFAVSRRWSDPIAATYRSVTGSPPTGSEDVYTGYYVFCTDGLVTWGSADAAVAYARAVSDLSEQIRGSTDISIDLFQLKQTAALGKDVKKVIHDYRNLLKMLGAGKITAIMKATGSAWLLFRYGIQPTLQTIYDASVYSAEYYRNNLQHYAGEGKVVRVQTVPVDNWPDAGGWTSTVMLQTSYRHRLYCQMRIPDDTQSQAARLTSLNPASIAWELLPGSFVIDWLWSLGGYLRDVETALIYDRYFVNGTSTSTSLITATQRGVRSKAPPAGVTWSGKYTSYGRWATKNRDILTSYPDVPAPQIMPQLGSGRLLNAAALLSQFLR